MLCRGMRPIMKALRVLFQSGLLIGLAIEIQALPASAQTPPPKEAQPPAPGLIKLTGDDARRAEDLEKAIGTALKADRWDEAIARVEEMLALRTRAQGPKHFETVNEVWRLKALRRVALMPPEDREAYQSALGLEKSREGLLGRREVHRGPVAFREGPGDLQTAAHRRPTRDRQHSRLPGAQPLGSGKAYRCPAAHREGARDPRSAPRR